MQTWIKANIGKLISRLSSLETRVTTIETNTGSKISEPITMEEYTAIDPKDPDTLYIVIDNNKLYIFLGNIPMEQAGIQNIVNYGGLTTVNVPVPVIMVDNATLEQE